jgi:hypothetical protein
MLNIPRLLYSLFLVRRTVQAYDRLDRLGKPHSRSGIQNLSVAEVAPLPALPLHKENRPFPRRKHNAVAPELFPSDPTDQKYRSLRLHTQPERC